MATLCALPLDLARLVAAWLVLDDAVALADATRLRAFLPPAELLDASVADARPQLRSERRPRASAKAETATALSPAACSTAEEQTWCVYHNQSLRWLLLRHAEYARIAFFKVDAAQALDHLGDAGGRERERVAIEILEALDQQRRLNTFALARVRILALRLSLCRVVAWTFERAAAPLPPQFFLNTLVAWLGYDRRGLTIPKLLQWRQLGTDTYAAVLAAAAGHGRPDLVRVILAERNLPSLVSQEMLQLALAAAGANGHDNVLDILITAAQDRALVLEATETLTHACRHRHHHVITYLLASPRVRLDSPVPAHGISTPLAAAVESGDTRVVLAVLVDPRVNAWDPLAFQRAACVANVQILKRLAQHEGCRLSDVNRALRSLVRSPNAQLSPLAQSSAVRELVDQLVRSRLDPSSSWELIDLLCVHGDVDVVETVLHAFATQPKDNSDRRFWRPLVTAARHGQRKCDTEVAEALLAACLQDCLSSVKLLLPLVDSDLLQLLRVVEGAAAAPTCAVLQWMLSTKADAISLCDLDAALQYACAHGRTAGAVLLLRNVGVRFAEGLAIQFAAASGSVVLVRLLLMDPRVDESYDLETALVDAAREGHVAVVAELLADARLHITSGAAFHEACELGRLDVLRLLMQTEVMWREPHLLELDVSFSRATRRGHYAVIHYLLNDPRVSLRHGGAVTRVEDLPKRPGDPRWCTFLRRFFRHQRVDPAADDCQLLLDACLQGKHGVVDALLRSGRIHVAETTLEAVKDLARLSAASTPRVAPRFPQRQQLIATDLLRYMRSPSGTLSRR